MTEAGESSSSFPESEETNGGNRTGGNVCITINNRPNDSNNTASLSLGSCCDSLCVGLTIPSVRAILYGDGKERDEGAGPHVGQGEGGEGSSAEISHRKVARECLTNGVVYEVIKELESIGVSHLGKSFCRVIAEFFELKDVVDKYLRETSKMKTLCNYLKKVKNNYQRFNKCKNKKRLCDYLSLQTAVFGKVDVCGEVPVQYTDYAKLERELEQRKAQYAKLETKLKMLSSELAEHKAKEETYKEICAERGNLIRKVNQLEKDSDLQQKLIKSYQKTVTKLNDRNRRNRSKREARQLVTIKELREELRFIKSRYSEVLATLQERLTNAFDKQKSATKKIHYYKKKCKTAAVKHMADVKELKSELKKKYALLRELKEKVDDFISREEGTLITMEKGKYKDSIREVYQFLMTMNVGAKNCEPIVRVILSKLADLTPDRLPGETFAGEMMLEARTMAQLQAYHSLLQTDNLTLCSDGTTRRGHHYGAYDVSFSEGKIFTLGVRQTTDGTSTTTLDILIEVLQDLIDLGLDRDLGLGKFLVKIKNVMSDRHTVQKKFNQLLADFRSAYLPVVIKEWNTLNITQQTKACELNEFFCGMHFVVGLAEQASLATKAWEHMIFGEEKVGATSLTSFAAKDECGTERLIRTVCKCVQERGCEMEGKPVQFRAFLSTETEVVDVPLAPFIGNRFNILFHNGAGVYFLHNHLVTFFDRYKSENRLMSEVNADLGVPQFKAGVKALGIVDKVITVPLWRALEKETHILNMNKRYARLVDCFRKWSDDATNLLHGTDTLFSDISVKKDAVYSCLMENNELDGMVKQLLEMQCSSFLMLAHRMLSDHLEGGRYFSVDEDQMQETHSVPTTNTTVERDFGMLDRLIREKPNASTIALEGMIMYKRNKTSEWTASLEDSVRSEFLEIARKSKAQQKKTFVNRLCIIQENRKKKEVLKKEAFLRREEQNRARKTMLLQDITDGGGLAKTQEILDQRLSELESPKQRRLYLQTQIKFRRYVLGAKNEGGIMNLSTAGKAKTPEELRQALITVMAKSDQEETAARSKTSRKVIGLAPTNAVEKFKRKLREPPAKKAKLSTATNGVPSSALDQEQQLDIPNQVHVSANEQSTSNLSMDRPEILVGKRFSHKTEVDSALGWYSGTVLGLEDKTIFVRYDGYEQPYHFTTDMIEKDIMEGEFKLLKVDPEYFIGKDVKHLWLLDDGDEMWCSGTVMSLVEAKGDDTTFEIAYDSNEEEDDDVLTLPLLRDYLNNELRFT